MWPGDYATVDAMGGVELRVNLEDATLALTPALSQREMGERGEREQLEDDPITLAVVEHRLESIAQEMTEAMLRTAMSQILNSSRDFSTAILDGDCQLVAQGEGIPVHISALPGGRPQLVRDYFGEDIHDGDLFILNDPYFGGSHLPDITIIRPVFHEGRLLFYGVNRGAPQRRRRRHPRRLQPRRQRDIPGGPAHTPVEALRQGRARAATCCKCSRPTSGSRRTSWATSTRR